MLDTDILTVKEVFETKRQLSVPLFQRRYVWNRWRQWQPLWEDVVAVADAVIREDDIFPHFLGAVVLQEQATATKDIDRRTIIDGQQRLTTLQVLLQAFTDLCRYHENDEHPDLLDDLTRNSISKPLSPDDLFKLWPTNHDRDQFRTMMKVGSFEGLRQAFPDAMDPATEKEDEGADREPDHPLVEAYLYFWWAIDTWLRDGEEGVPARIGALYDALCGKVQIVVIDLTEGDDAQLIFETLNGRMTRLEPADLIKNLLFHQARRDEQDIEALHEQYWMHFEAKDRYWSRPQGRGHARRPRMSSFLLNYLTIQTGKEVPAAHIHATFRSHVQKATNLKTLDHLKRLNLYAGVYRRLDELEVPDADRQFLARVKAMDYASALIFLLELWVRFEKRPEVRRPIQQDLESFLVRRMICGLNTRGYNRMFIGFIPVLDQPDPAKTFRQLLLEGTADSNRWPNDGRFSLAFLESPLGDMLRTARIRLILEALELHMQSDKSEGLNIKKPEVEHIMPQAWETNWPLSDDRKSDPEAVARRHRDLQTLGNLTLLKDKLNRGVTNWAWTKKRPEIDQHSQLMLNREIVKVVDWNEEAIRERGERLFDRAVQIWPYPSEG